MTTAGGRQGLTGGLILSREDELQAIESFVDDPGSGRCLVLHGDPGLGKTMLWEEAVRLGRTHGYRVALTRASEAEATLLFAAVADLLDGVSPVVFDEVPGPQRLALEVALRPAEPAESAPEPFAIAAAFLHVVRLLADQQPILIAVDDVHWLDPSSAQLLLFAARRLAHHDDSRVRFVLSRRAGRQTALEGVLRPAGLVHLEVGALSLGAISLLLGERLGAPLTHRSLRQIHLAPQGNPLLALELGRSLSGQEVPEFGADPPFPDLVDEIFGERVRRLPDPLRQVLLAAALSADVAARGR